VEEMVVEMFSISNGYGFCLSPNLGKVFFRVEDFRKLGTAEPQPILGESVLVGQIIFSEKSPKSFEVTRIKTPLLLTGEVKSFDSTKGWGFAESYTGLYFIHKSDFMESFIPIIGTDIQYYNGKKKGRKRACYIKRSYNDR